MMSNKSFSSLFITGTDTGVGKTVVMAGLALALQHQGYDVGVMKPVATGGITSNGSRLISPDVKFLLEATGITDPPELINPILLKPAQAPLIAARLCGVRINLAKVWSAYKILRKRHEILLVEGVGGLLVPLKGNYLVRDLVKDMKLPLLVVSRPVLGTINHTLLTLTVARAARLPYLGFLFNYHHPFGSDPARSLIISCIQRLSKVPYLGIIPYLKQLTPQKLPLRYFQSILQKLS